MTITDDHINELLEILTTKRPDGGMGEAYLIQEYIEPLNPVMDEAGNFYVVVGDRPTTMFSSHTDTVHRKDGFQEIKYDAAREEIFKTDQECLGADDGTGIWIMRRLIEAEVPGLYVFHRGEEIGGVGSKHASSKEAARFEHIQRAIAFDRKGFSDVITHQGWGRCCSDEFAKALSSALSSKYLAYTPDDTGVFTDTANYVDLIPECTNLSVGYNHEHTAKETQNVAHLRHFVPALIAVDWEALPTKRDPTVIDEDDYLDRWDDKTDHGWPNRRASRSTRRTPVRDEGEYGFQALYDYACKHPGIVAVMLEEYGISTVDLDEIRFQFYDDDTLDTRYGT